MLNYQRVESLGDTSQETLFSHANRGDCGAVSMFTSIISCLGHPDLENKRQKTELSLLVQNLWYINGKAYSVYTFPQLKNHFGGLPTYPKRWKQLPNSQPPRQPRGNAQLWWGKLPATREQLSGTNLLEAHVVMNTYQRKWHQPNNSLYLLTMNVCGSKNGTINHGQCPIFGFVIWDVPICKPSSDRPPLRTLLDATQRCLNSKNSPDQQPWEMSHDFIILYMCLQDGQKAIGQ